MIRIYMTCNLILASYVYSNHSCNFFGIEIEVVSNCGSMVRYRIGENGVVSEKKRKNERLQKRLERGVK